MEDKEFAEYFITHDKEDFYQYYYRYYDLITLLGKETENNVKKVLLSW